MADHDQGEEPADPPRPQPLSRPDVTPQESPKKRKRISAFFAILVSLIVFISVFAVSMALTSDAEATMPLAGIASIISLLVLFLISGYQRRKEVAQERGDLEIFSAEEYEELQHFVGPRTDTTDYYLPRWKTGKNGFNSAGCLFGVFWLLYRKMYKASLIIVGICLLFQLAVLRDNSESVMEYRGLRALALWLGIIIGCCGNSWYLSRARKVISEERSWVGPNRRDVLLEKISKRGGVSWVLPFAYLFYLLAFILLVYLLDPLPF